MNTKYLSACALVVAAAGEGIQMASGNIPGYSGIPPGALILVGAAIVTVLPGRWSPLAAVLAAGFLTFGLFAADQATRLVEVVNAGDTVGLWLQLVAMVVALVAGILAIARPAVAPGQRES